MSGSKKLPEVRRLAADPIQIAPLQALRLGSQPLQGDVSTLGCLLLRPCTINAQVQQNAPLVSEEVSVTTLDEDIRDMSLPAPDFIKIDVEGFERSVLQGAREALSRHKPEPFIEIHGETMELKRKNVAAVVECLNDFGYRDIQHLESAAAIDASNSSLAAQGHLICHQARFNEPFK